ncbi:hypothetical protein PISL3812_05648 [Talaromyces islandicus]|uniref:Profilin n=1 Tax=Talaromyces islandicus TaxID=28573 RepID=A0A0U1LZ65_TALIS|nr:hypothetical protein PISL3812_05648 [Talaromyces islandicus]
MSWDGYLAQHVVGTGHVDKALIIDQTGQAVWGKGSEVEMTPEEMNNLAFAFNDATAAQTDGILVEGEKYVFTTVLDIENIPVMHCPKGKQGIIAAKCTKSILVTHYNESTPAQSALSHVVGNAKHLIEYDL